MKPLFVFFATGFEEIEAIATVDILRRAELPTIMISTTGSLDVTGAHGIVIHTDQLFEETDFGSFTMLILPGGSVALGEYPPLVKLLEEAHSLNRPISAICAAPAILGNLGMLEGEEAICYPGFESWLKGATISARKVVASAHFITGKGPGATLEFALKIVETIKGSRAAQAIREAMIID